jgi:hypothetical protein
MSDRVKNLVPVKVHLLWSHETSSLLFSEYWLIGMVGESYDNCEKITPALPRPCTKGRVSGLQTIPPFPRVWKTKIISKIFLRIEAVELVLC